MIITGHLVSQTLFSILIDISMLIYCHKCEISLILEEVLQKCLKIEIKEIKCEYVAFDHILHRSVLAKVGLNGI
jgi:hypothetical protein